MESLNCDHLQKHLPALPSWRALGLSGGLGADAECSHMELLPHAEPGTCTVAPSRRQRLRESHGAGSAAVVSVQPGKRLLSLSAAREVYVLSNKVHVPYANARPLEW